MEYIKENEADAQVYVFKDRWTFKDHRKAAAIFDEIESMSRNRCIVDLHDVAFIDSAGLGMLLMMREKVKAKGGEVVIRGAAPDILRVMKLARFDTVFTLAE